MKSISQLTTGWSLAKVEPVDALDITNLIDQKLDWINIVEMPRQVHDVLFENKLIDEEMRIGWCESCLWVHDFDWVYQCNFKRPDHVGDVILCFDGLDTVVDIYLNGQLIGKHNNLYLTQEIEITDLLVDENVMVLHFHNIDDELKKSQLKPEWEKTIIPEKLIRKPFHDLYPPVEEGSSYQGVVPSFRPIGVYRNVCLKLLETARINEDHIMASVSDPYYEGTVRVKLAGASGELLVTKITDAEGIVVAQKEIALLVDQAGQWTEDYTLTVDHPQLWNPIGFGDAVRYTVTIMLYDQDEPQEILEKKIGFREIISDGNLGFTINGNLVRLWGGSMDPMQGYTHCWDKQRSDRIFHMIENAHMNTLRIWGEGIPCAEDFYDTADEHGILIWQEFFLGNGAYPDTPEFKAEYKKEAIQLIKRLRHRACLLMWCGGNEMVMGSEYIDINYPVIGREVVEKEFQQYVDEYDTTRGYWPCSPYGGEWANDARTGDFHTYNGIWAYPYAEYPNFISEDIYTAAPVMHSLKRMIKGDVWPEGYTGKLTKECIYPFPDTWVQRTFIPAQGFLKTGSYWEYYDAENAEDHLYRFGAAAADRLRRTIERVRQGKDEGERYAKKRTKGYFACKLLDTWPKVYCAIIDFFQEGFHSYYATVAALRPIALSFQITNDGYRLWLANDSNFDVKGKLEFGFFDIDKNDFVRFDEYETEMPKGHSGLVLNLDKYAFFPKTQLLYARFVDEEQNIDDSVVDMVDVERHYRFPNAKLNIEIQGDEIIITTDKFARNIQITAENEETKFGWLFSENYFDLLPNQKKVVKITAGETGIITVKPHYADAVTVSYVK